MKTKNLTLTACLLAACAWCFTLVSRADSSEPVTGEFAPVASVEALMNGQVLVFKTIGELVANKNAPKRADQIEELAEVLAELANVNTFNSDKADYRDWAGTLRDTSMELARSAKQGADDGKMNGIIKRMKGACQACHDAYQ